MKQVECHKIPRMVLTKRHPVQRPLSLAAHQRKRWDQYVADSAKRDTFQKEINMDHESFMKLLSWIRPALIRNIRQFPRGPLIPENRLYAVLCFLTGESQAKIFYRFRWWGISDSSFYKIVFSTMDAINEVPALAMKFPTTEEECIEIAREFQKISEDAIDTCVCAIDGYMIEIEEPEDDEDDESFDGDDFWSPSYGAYGINIQAACDHLSRFLFLGIGGPGSRHDDEALVECPLGDLIEKLPGNYCAITDCGYLPTEHVIPEFGRDEGADDAKGNFTYYAEKCRMRIENAFGLMLKSWPILLDCPFEPKEVWRLLECIGRLHNFCIDERISKDLPPGTDDAHKHICCGAETVRWMHADERFDKFYRKYRHLLKSRNRDRLVARIVSKGLEPSGPFDDDWKGSTVSLDLITE